MSDRSKQSKPTSSTGSTIRPKCEDCGGTGRIAVKMTMRNYIEEFHLEHIYADESFETWVYRKCPTCNGGMWGRIDSAKKYAGVPTTFYDKKLTSFDWNLYEDKKGRKADTNTQAKIVASFVRDFEKWDKAHRGLYIYSGTKGSGKTFLASCICNELMEKAAIKTRFVNCSELIDIVRSGDKDSYEELKRDPLKLLKECKLLVLDDIGQKSGNAYHEDLIYQIVDERLRNERLTIYTSNLKVSELPFDDRITDRIGSTTTMVYIPETMIRARKASEDNMKFLKEMGVIE